MYVFVSKDFKVHCKQLSNEKLCFIHQNAKTEEEHEGTALELLERFNPFLRSIALSERYSSRRGTFDAEDLFQEGRKVLLECAVDYCEVICPVFTVYMERCVRYAINNYCFNANDVRRKHNSKKDREGCPSLKSEIGYSLDELDSGDKSDVRLMSSYVSFEDVLLNRDEQIRVRKAFATELSKQEQCIINMRDFNGMRWMDIADRLGVCCKTAQNSRRRAIDKLRKAML